MTESTTQPITAQNNQTSNEPAQRSQPAPEATPAAPQPIFNKPVTEELVVEWMAPSRPFKKRKQQYFSTIFIIALLLSLILFFAGQFIFIAVVVAFVFLSYVLAVIPPGMITYSFTTYGVRIEEQLYYWDELGRFWFTTKHGQKILHIEVGRFPWRLSILLGETPEEPLAEMLSEVLINQQPPLTLYEKAAKWVEDKIPLEE
ncbi:MAG: hypothetical protein M3Q81_05055 [bacterium]|nr:hypothetical protein [bacterium]